MKSKINKIIAAILIYNLSFIIYNCEAQTIPNAVNFQAIARNAGGALITNANVQVKVEVLDGSSGGPVMVTMVYTPTTDAYGQFTFAIGAGSPVVTAGTVANFAAIDWASSAKFIKVSLSPLADNNYTLISNTQATSSFYAFGAKTAEKINITGTSGQVLKHNGTTWVAGTDEGSTFIAPTVQRFTSGSGTYTTPANVKYIKVRMVGGGGGGAGGAQNTVLNGGAGGAGGNTLFGSATANGGNGGPGGSSGAGAVGGTGSLGTFTVGYAVQGGSGTAGAASFFGPNSATGGHGGCSVFLGNGVGQIQNVGTAAVVNSGSGGGGGAGSPATNVWAGAGGGGGGYVEIIINSPSPTYTYTIGAGGTAGTAGTSGVAGGAGGSGVIIVTEYYQ